MDIRAEFLKYFQNKDHKLYESSPLVPDDATLLFTNAGMVQFKDIFTGTINTPNPPRATSSQTCLRAGGKHNDLENVGYTARHHTFFEMLGNFSFGDYFKTSAIEYAWDFITNVLEIPIDKLWVTVHENDDEAYAIWTKIIDPKRIMRLGDKDNFWQMGDTGPCGPCSEIFYDQGAKEFHTDEDYLGGDGDRFLEIWNLVFMQYQQHKDGSRTKLPNPSIDTGMGLERVVAIKEGVSSNYSSSLFMPIINEISNICNINYEYSSGASFRVIADHIRSVSFLLAQGVTFDKVGRGYVLRRILRRAVRHGYKLGIKKPFLYTLVDVLVSIMGESYPYLKEKKDFVKNQIQTEEKRFFYTIEDGIKLFNTELQRSKDIFDGKVAFKLYDTYGFPLDLTIDMLKETNLKLDTKAYENEMQQQKNRSKQNTKFSAEENSQIFKTILEEFQENFFIGYDQNRQTTDISYLLNSDFEIVDELNNQTGWIITKESILYPNGGGQVGDNGKIYKNDTLIAKVLDTKKFFGIIASQIEAKEIKKNDTITITTTDNRHETSKHHSATHLLHNALRNTLGEHISQAGSLVDSTKLRFDFTHNEALSSKQLNEIENQVNIQIQKAYPTTTKIQDIKEAKASGAMALFGEKYSDKVRVVSLGANSVELCGGTHVSNTAEIGICIITKESGVSAGVRRIEAICGKSAYKYIKSMQNDIQTNIKLLKSQNLTTGITKLKNEILALKKELKENQTTNKQELEIDNINGYNLVVESINSGDIKAMVDEYKNKLDNIAILLMQQKGDKVLIVAGNKNTPLKAGNWIKNIAPILGGGGGGRDDFAQAGGKDTTKIAQAQKDATAFATNILKGN